MEGRQTRVDVFDRAGSGGEGADFVGLRSHVRVGIQGLEDGEQAVDVGVMQKEDWVKCAVAYDPHPSSNHAMDCVVDALQGIVLVASAIHVCVIGEWRILRLS